MLFVPVNPFLLWISQFADQLRGTVRVQVRFRLGPVLAEPAQADSKT